jgi:hypothetical protein
MLAVYQHKDHNPHGMENDRWYRKLPSKRLALAIGTLTLGVSTNTRGLTDAGIAGGLITIEFFASQILGSNAAKTIRSDDKPNDLVGDTSIFASSGKHLVSEIEDFLCEQPRQY